MAIFKVSSAFYNYFALLYFQISEVTDFSIFAQNKNTMKKILMLFVAIGLVACNSDDDATESGNNTTNYFPTTANSTWTYNNSSETADTTDQMSVNGTEQTNGNTYTNLDTANPANGFMVSVLTENLVRRDGGKLFINGTLGAPVEGFPTITIPLNDVVLYDANAANGATLSELTGSITETLMDLPLTFQYTSTSLQSESLASYTAGSQTFTDVIKSRIILNLAVSTSIDIGSTTLNVPILSAQDVLVVDNYYAANTGLIFSETTVDYQLEDLSSLGVDLPFPEQETQVSTATLASFSIGN